MANAQLVTLLNNENIEIEHLIVTKRDEAF